MKTKIFFLLVFLFSASIIPAQETDTLSFYSEAFGEQRTVYIHKPGFYKYKSGSVKLPVIFLLDGQHEWFINPILSDIKYLQYTHEIPNALVVVVPHKNRNDECVFSGLQPGMPLDIFITEELTRALTKYNPGEIRIIAGHSFSASFALYAYLMHPGFYTAVMAHTPLYELESLVEALGKTGQADKDRIYISTGGIAGEKDYHHRKKYDQLKSGYPDFFSDIVTFEADYSAHNAVPIVATPVFLTRIFERFRGRYAGIAKTDDEYKLIDIPETAEAEIDKVLEASVIGDYFYPPGIAEINGIASRYAYNGYNNQALEIYRLGITYYPDYYEFYLSLYELTYGQDSEQAREYLSRAEFLLKTVETGWDGKNALLDEIRIEKVKHGWE
jgi:hypothetical protein